MFFGRQMNCLQTSLYFVDKKMSSVEFHSRQLAQCRPEITELLFDLFHALAWKMVEQKCFWFRSPTPHVTPHDFYGKEKWLEIFSKALCYELEKFNLF